MSAAIYNIEIEQGSDFEITLVVSGQNLVGFSARSQIRTLGRGQAMLGEFTFSIASPTSQGGTITMTLPGFESIDIPPGTFVYDMEVFNDTSRKSKKLIKGTCTIIQGVTR